MKSWIPWVSLSVLVMLQGCGAVPVETRSPNEVVKAVDSAPPEPQWVQFGIVEWITPATVASEGGEPEEAMRLSIRMDTGEEITVEQAVSQAGRFNIGDRVRVLHIGDFYRVTYWPYESRSAPPARMPGANY